MPGPLALALGQWCLLPQTFCSSFCSATCMQHFQALGNSYGNTKLPWRSASCCCRLFCVVPSPKTAPSPSPGCKSLKMCLELVQILMHSPVHGPVQSPGFTPSHVSAVKIFVITHFGSHHAATPHLPNHAALNEHKPNHGLYLARCPSLF